MMISTRNSPFGGGYGLSASELQILSDNAKLNTQRASARRFADALRNAQQLARSVSRAGTRPLPSSPRLETEARERDLARMRARAAAIPQARPKADHSPEGRQRYVDAAWKKNGTTMRVLSIGLPLRWSASTGRIGG